MARADVITINRAPVLTLWAAVVAERLGFDRDEAATLGRAVAGLNAASKAQRLGLARKREGPETPAQRKKRAAAEGTVELLGRAVPVAGGKQGVRALADGKPVTPESVHRYLEGKFGERLEDARAAMAALAASFAPAELAAGAYGLYEAFRPAIPSGTRGWGAKGTLDLALVRSLGAGSARTRRR